MKKETFAQLEQFMLENMKDAAHDTEHIYRVLYTAMDIAAQEKAVDYDVLIAACLLHDIGRQEQFADPTLCHAAVGAEKAYRYLVEHGFGEIYAGQVSNCIRKHRFRSDNPPVTLEEKILFDSDKVDAAGTMGIARTFLYAGHEGTPMYSIGADGKVSDGSEEEPDSFFREYKRKLERIYDGFLTERGKEIALERQAAAVRFYEDMLREVRDSREKGQELLVGHLEA